VIALVISDVDGTLVTPDKRLTEASIKAVQQLHVRGIHFSLTSSRPPFGLRMLVEPLSLKLPFGAFNGAALVKPDGEIIEIHLVPEPAARGSVDLMRRCGVDVWLYTADQWVVLGRSGAYVEQEVKTIVTEPTVVADLSSHLCRAAKIVGVSEDFTALAHCEEQLNSELAGAASVSRSQPYYLDVTPPGLNKGTLVSALAARLDIPLKRVAVVGDMENDVSMFRRVGVAIAMGNADETVKSRAKFVTDSNAAEGFAYAIERFILSDRQ
jgi:Cof subfamily protein (haloacid dehalogenase superfamily)